MPDARVCADFLYVFKGARSAPRRPARPSARSGALWRGEVTEGAFCGRARCARGLSPRLDWQLRLCTCGTRRAAARALTTDTAVTGWPPLRLPIAHAVYGHPPALQCEAGQDHAQGRCRVTRDDLRSPLRVILPSSVRRQSGGWVILDITGPPTRSSTPLPPTAADRTKRIGRRWLPGGRRSGGSMRVQSAQFWPAEPPLATGPPSIAAPRGCGPAGRRVGRRWEARRGRRSLLRR